MTAVEIINEIRLLPPAERAQVVDFIHALAAGGQLTGNELNELAVKLVGQDDAPEALRLKEEIARGFFGTENHA